MCSHVFCLHVFLSFTRADFYFQIIDLLHNIQKKRRSSKFEHADYSSKLSENQYLFSKSPRFSINVREKCLQANIRCGLQFMKPTQVGLPAAQLSSRTEGWSINTCRSYQHLASPGGFIRPNTFLFFRVAWCYTRWGASACFPVFHFRSFQIFLAFLLPKRSSEIHRTRWQA